MGQFPMGSEKVVPNIQFNLDRKYRNKEIAILSDSQAVIKALSSANINSMMVLECLGKLNDLGRNNKVSLLWVPRVTNKQIQQTRNHSAALENHMSRKYLIKLKKN